MLPPPTNPPKSLLKPWPFPLPPWMINTLSPLAHLEKPHDSQALGFRSRFRSRTRPPSIATRFPSLSRKNFPIVDYSQSIDRYYILYLSIIFFGALCVCLSPCGYQTRRFRFSFVPVRSLYILSDLYGMKYYLFVNSFFLNWDGNTMI